MNSRIGILLDQVKADPWRLDVGFTPEIASTLAVVSKGSDQEVIDALNGWLARYQPCLFGRIAAKKGLLSYCILREDDLRASADHLRNKIHTAHLAWTKAGFEGRASGFIIVAISDRLASGQPDEIVKEIALELCSVYLDQPVEVDRVWHDEIWLQQPGNKQATWAWQAGVNFFSSQGDRRWWQDHRFPSGLAFSINSVGHMVKSGKLMLAVQEMEEVMGTGTGELQTRVVDSLEKALELAMRTIDMAADGPSGKATRLIRLPSDRSNLPECPVRLPGRLAEMNFCEYLGYYNTDYTVPTEYFLPAVERPSSAYEHPLDFKYLFHRSAENPDFFRMGEGRRIRASGPLPRPVSPVKQARGTEREVLINEIPRLREALGI